MGIFRIQERYNYANGPNETYVIYYTTFGSVNKYFKVDIGDDGLLEKSIEERY